ncbi:MAG: choice-of-anchor D domain-containing protein, partial [Cytophagales bacterium]|nr:choice-of-anchor D domain-containing protein [Cytophagales bacterium]
MKKQYQPLFLFVSLFLILSSAYAQDYYVSALAGADTNDGLTPATPLATIQQGADLVNPGGTVFIMNGTYSRTAAGAVLHFTRSGTPEGYVTFRPYPGHTPVITATGSVWNAVVLDGSYVVIDGLEFEGRNADLTLAGAEESYRQSRQTPAVFNARYNTNGISMATVPGINPHHIIIRNCKVHDFPGGGINVGNGAGAGATASGVDYVTVENNEVYNNCWYTMYATSGISVIGPKPIDNVTGYKIFIRGNRCYNNFTQVKWRRSNPAQDALSDGNGIILDVNNGSQNRPVYTGRTLVENNVSYNNGGGGIHAFQAARIDIFNNTAYNNGKVVGYPEIDGQSGTDVRIYNNIMYARTGGACNLNDAGAVYDHNVYYNGSYFRQGANDLVADPLFAKPGLDGGADFRLQANSPALNTGNATAGFFSAQDITGLARPQGSKPERGAYEFQTGSQDQTISFAALPTLTIGDADYDPQATASSGLPVHYTSSNLEVAVVFNGKIQVVGGGTTTITAVQGGNGTYAAAPEVSRPLVVDGAGYGPLPLNGTFEGGAEGWSTFARVPGSISLAAVPKTGYDGNALEATVPSVVSPGSFDLQAMHPMPLVAGRTYTIRFRASTAVAAPVDVILQSNAATNRSFFAIRITAVPTEYTLSYTATATDDANFLKFMVGKLLAPLYLDDVTITAAPAPVMTIRQGDTVIADNTATSTTGSYDFGAVPFGSARKVTFSIENTGARTLSLLYAQQINVTGAGFSLAANVPAPTVAPGGKVTFEVQFRPDSSGTFTGALTIANNDPALSKNPYNFILKATAPKAGQTITFAGAPVLTYGDAGRALAATATSGLPVMYAVVSGPGVLADGNVLSPTGAGDIVIEATQAGNNNYNAALPMQQTVTVARKDLLVTAGDLTLTYGDAVPAYTYTLTGFVFGQTAADVAGSPVLRSAYTPATPATESPAIVVETGSLSAPNYRFVPVNGK